jgi:hypothetical protein
MTAAERAFTKSFSDMLLDIVGTHAVLFRCPRKLL